MDLEATAAKKHSIHKFRWIIYQVNIVIWNSEEEGLKITATRRVFLSDSGDRGIVDYRDAKYVDSWAKVEK